MTRRRAAPAPSHDWAWFLDLDGTLVHIARSPHGVLVDRGVRRLVDALVRATGGAVALISGRSIADLDQLLRRRRLPLAGQHGLERRAASGRVTVHRAGTARLDRARKALVHALAWQPDLLLEDKGLSLALHYRGAPALASYAHRLVRAQLGALGAAWCMQPGKRLVEIRPAGRDKGKAVLAFMRERPFRGRVPVFVGDDLTDEYAFAVVNRLGGISVKVGRGPTEAAWRLADVDAVHGWIRRGHPAPRPVR